MSQPVEPLAPDKKASIISRGATGGGLAAPTVFMSTFDDAMDVTVGIHVDFARGALEFIVNVVGPPQARFALGLFHPMAGGPGGCGEPVAFGSHRSQPTDMPLFCTDSGDAGPTADGAGGGPTLRFPVSSPPRQRGVIMVLRTDEDGRCELRRTTTELSVYDDGDTVCVVGKQLALLLAPGDGSKQELVAVGTVSAA